MKKFNRKHFSRISDGHTFNKGKRVVSTKRVRLRKISVLPYDEGGMTDPPIPCRRIRKKFSANGKTIIVPVIKYGKHNSRNTRKEKK